MPRDVSGNYTLPAGNPVVGGTVIEASWANPTMDDIGEEITNSLDRNGRGGMLVSFRVLDGNVGAPAYSFTDGFTSGLYRAGTNDIRMATGGADLTRWISGTKPFEIWDGSAFNAPLIGESSENPTFGSLIVVGTIDASNRILSDGVGVNGEVIVARSEINAASFGQLHHEGGSILTVQSRGINDSTVGTIRFIVEASDATGLKVMTFGGVDGEFEIPGLLEASGSGPLFAAPAVGGFRIYGEPDDGINIVSNASGTGIFSVRDELANTYLRVFRSGNVNIPLGTLTVTGDILASGIGNQFLAQAENTPGAPQYSWLDDTDTGIFNFGANHVGLSTSGVLAMSWDSSQQTSVFAKMFCTADLEVGNVGESGQTDGIRLNIVGGSIEYSISGASSTPATFYNTSGTVGTITTLGSVTSYNTTSEPLLKTPFEEFDALEMVSEACLANAVGWAGFLIEPDTKYPMFNGQWMAENQPYTGGRERTDDISASMDYGKRTPVHEAAIYQLLQRVQTLEGLLAT